MGQYPYGKKKETMTFEEFDKALRNAKEPLKYSSFLTFLYLTGARLTEILERKKQDFKIEEEVLVVYIPSKKHGTREYLELGLDFPYVKEIIIPQIEKTKRPGRRVWRFTSRTAQRVIDRVFGKEYYPHFFRLNVAVSMCRNPDTTFQDLRAWFGWKKIESIDSYMGLARRDISEARTKRGKEFKK